jgi:hypothetical protein
MALDREAYDHGYDDGRQGRDMLTWKAYTGGNPGYNRSWGSYKRGYRRGNDNRNGIYGKIYND